MADFPPDDDPPPTPPERPRYEDCCGGGCNPCIFEQYDEAVLRYDAELKAWRERQKRRGDQRTA